VSCGICHHCPDCGFGEAGWRVILQALATAPHFPDKVEGLNDGFVNATDFEPAAVLRDLKWPVDLLQQPNPNTAIPQFCRELHKGAHSGDPVASLLLLGPGGAGKSTLLHRLTKGEFNTSIKSTDGLRIGACCARRCAMFACTKQCVPYLMLRTRLLVLFAGVLSVNGDCTRHTTTSTPSTTVRPSSPSTTATTANTSATATGTPLTPPSTVTLRTVDFGGQREYLYTHPLFCTSRAVYVLCAPLDELFGKPTAEVVDTLREYASMVQVRAPDAPLVVVFTKADQVPGMTPGAMPASAATTRWIHAVLTALRAEFSQVAGGNDGDESTCSALVLSSKDGWEASHVRACDRWAQLALASPGAGDTLPASYGKMRDALGVAGAAWKKKESDCLVTTLDAGVEETKGVEGGSSSIVDEDDVSATRDGSNSDVPLVMQWGAQVPIVTVAAVRDMAVQHCGLSRDADIHQPLLLLHHMGCVVYGGALVGTGPSQEHGDATPSHPDLSQLVVLDPQWLANMLSRVVTQYARHRDDSGTPIARGQVPLRDVALAWHGYPDELRGSFLEVLFALEVAFPGMREDGGVSDTIIVPALLPAVPSNAEEAVAAMLSSRRSSVKQVSAG